MTGTSRRPGQSRPAGWFRTYDANWDAPVYTTPDYPDKLVIPLNGGGGYRIYAESGDHMPVLVTPIVFFTWEGITAYLTAAQ